MPKILVVDDSGVDRSRVAGLLGKHEDLIVDFATHGADALKRVESDPPDLVLTDLIMPEINGLQLVAALASDHPLIPVILMTGRGSEQIAVQALQAGASSYVPKRQLASMLVETVRHVLEAAQQQRSEAQLMDCMTRSENTFRLRADPAMIPALVNHVHEIMRQMGICEESDLIRVCVALEEAINNALFHGNLEIDSQCRSDDTESYRRLVENRCRTKPFSERVVHVEAGLSRRRARFVVRDQGTGFDPSGLPDPTDPENLERACGRGLLLMRTFMDSVQFNRAGNEVTMVKHATRPSDGDGAAHAAGPTDPSAKRSIG